MQLTETETLKLENIHLKGQMLQAQLQAVNEALQQHVKATMESHGADPTTHGIDLAKGMIVPHQPQSVAPSHAAADALPQGDGAT